jgi:hypothetical protein
MKEKKRRAIEKVVSEKDIEKVVSEKDMGVSKKMQSIFVFTKTLSQVVIDPII